MTDIDPEREWYYSISVHLTIDSPVYLRGVIRQRDARTRQELVADILVAHWCDPHASYATVHHLERNDL